MIWWTPMRLMFIVWGIATATNVFLIVVLVTR
jgi:hypothetical protein